MIPASNQGIKNALQNEERFSRYLIFISSSKGMRPIDSGALCGGFQDRSIWKGKKTMNIVDRSTQVRFQRVNSHAW